MTSYPPTPAFGGFPSVLVNPSRKLSINTSNSNSDPTSPAIPSPNHHVRTFNGVSRSQPNAATPLDRAPPRFSGRSQKHKKGSLEDREEGELSDVGGEVEIARINKPNSNFGGRQQYNEGPQQQQQLARELVSRPTIQATGPLHATSGSAWTGAYHAHDEPTYVPPAWNYHTTGLNPGYDASMLTPDVQRGKKLPNCDRTPGPPNGSNEKGSNWDYYTPPAGNVAPSLCAQPHSPFHYGSAATATQHPHPLPLQHPYNRPLPEALLQNPQSLRKEAEIAVLNMLPLKVTFANMEEEGINPKVLRKVFTRIGFPIPAETLSPSPAVENSALPEDTRHIAKASSPQKTDIAKDAALIRKQLEKAAQDKERREAELRAAELSRQREAAREEAERSKRSAEVEAKKEVLRRKIGALNLPGKALSPALQTPAPISTTPVVAAIASSSVATTRIPGLMLEQPDGNTSGAMPALPPVSSVDGNDTVMVPVSSVDGNDTIMTPAPSVDGNDTVMKDSRPAEPQRPSTVSPPIINPTTPEIASPLSSERPLNPRKKRPVAADMYAETPPIKRKFGEQRFERLVIDISDDEEEADELDETARTSRATPVGGVTAPSQSRSTSAMNITPHPYPTIASPSGTPNGGNNNGTHSKAKALEEEIKVLKQAILEAQQKKKFAGVLTPTPTETPNNGSAGASAHPGLTPVVISVSSAGPRDEQTELPGDKKSEESDPAGERHEEATRSLGESPREANEGDAGILPEEVTEIEAAGGWQRLEAAVAADNRRKRKEEKESRLEESRLESARMKSRVARQKLQEQLEIFEHQKRALEQARKAVEKELEILDADTSITTPPSGGSEPIDISLGQKAAEITTLNGDMEDVEVDRSIPPGLSISKNNAPPSGSPPRHQAHTEPTESYQSEASVPPPKQKFAEAMDLDNKIGHGNQVNVWGPQIDIDMELADDVDIEYLDSAPDDTLPKPSPSSPDQSDPSDEEDMVGMQLQAEPTMAPGSPSSSVKATEQALIPVEDETAESKGHKTNLPNTVAEKGSEKAMTDMADDTKVVAYADNNLPTDYISPLAIFKSFRYHPRFLEMVQGGYRSLTYSNRIQPAMFMCRYEIDGGVCNDTTCHNQHFRQIAMLDDDIVVELASIKEGKTETEKADYLSGLRDEIAKMRAEHITDFTTVATGIVDYRRRFLGDESRVLVLP